MKYELLPADVDNFSFEEEDTTIDSYIFNCFVGGKKYLLKESDDVNKAKKHLLKMWVLAKIVNFLWYLGLFWLVFFKIGVADFVFYK